MYDPPGRDAAIVRQALSANIDVKAATEVICSRTPSQIQHFKQLYYARFGAYLEHDIEYQTSGDHKKVNFSLSLSRAKFYKPVLYLYVFSFDSLLLYTTKRHFQSSADHKIYPIFPMCFL